MAIKPECVSNYFSSRGLTPPQVSSITDVRKYMAESNRNYDGSVLKLTEHIVEQEKEMQDLQKSIAEQVTIKKAAMVKLKEDLLKLRQAIKMHDNSKIIVKFADENVAGIECDIHNALLRYGLKMSALYRDILTLDTDVDYLGYLRTTSADNKQTVAEWCNSEWRNKKPPMNCFTGGIRGLQM